MRIDIDHIDTLIKGADPADTSCLAGADSPEAEQIWERVLAATSSGTAAPFSRPGPGRSRGVVWPAISVGTVAVVVILVLQFLPTPALQAPSAAAAALRRLADQAAVAEPAPILKDDQWLQSEYQVSYLAAPPHIAPESSAVESARAVVTVNAEDWANNLSQSCSQQVVTSVTYKNPASQRAWSSGGIGLPSTASPQCVSGMLGKVSQSAGTLDVAKLPTDPSALAQALRTGTTGLAVLDHPFIGGRELTPFGRAVTLLASPTLGATPALWSALLRAMATMPGVALLGTTTAHNGAVGVALAGATGEGYRTTIILSPSTGALLEARNLMVDQLVAGLGGSIGVVTIQWLDPSGIPRVVDADMLPSSLAGEVPTGIVSAVADSGVTRHRVSAWLSSILPELPRHISANFATTGNPSVNAISVITLTPDPDVARIRELFQRSGLFHAIRSAQG